MDHEVVLLGFWTSPYVMRVKIALEEKGVCYKYLEQDIFDKSSKGLLLLKTNPVHKKVPVFLHNDKPVCESLNILQYIDDIWNDKAAPKLLSEDPYHRAKSRFWVDFFDKKVRAYVFYISIYIIHLKSFPF
jgi:glutathione S-transferase